MQGQQNTACKFQKYKMTLGNFVAMQPPVPYAKWLCMWVISVQLHSYTITVTVIASWPIRTFLNHSDQLVINDLYDKVATNDIHAGYCFLALVMHHNYH